MGSSPKAGNSHIKELRKSGQGQYRIIADLSNISVDSNVECMIKNGTEDIQCYLDVDTSVTFRTELNVKEIVEQTFNNGVLIVKFKTK